MKKIVLAALAATIAVPAAAAPGDTATDQGAATATIVAPISIVHDGGALDFGIIVSPTVVSTVAVSGGSAANTSGDAVVLSGGAADTFTVSGEAGRSFTIGTANETMGGGMSFTTSAPGSGTIGAGGSVQFSVEGELTIPAAQAAGTYTGTYDAEVTYL